MRYRVVFHHRLLLIAVAVLIANIQPRKTADQIKCIRVPIAVCLSVQDRTDGVVVFIGSIIIHINHIEAEPVMDGLCGLQRIRTLRCLCDPGCRCPYLHLPGGKSFRVPGSYSPHNCCSRIKAVDVDVDHTCRIRNRNIVVEDTRVGSQVIDSAQFLPLRRFCPQVTDQRIEKLRRAEKMDAAVSRGDLQPRIIKRLPQRGELYCVCGDFRICEHDPVTRRTIGDLSAAHPRFRLQRIKQGKIIPEKRRENRCVREDHLKIPNPCRAHPPDRVRYVADPPAYLPGDYRELHI